VTPRDVIFWCAVGTFFGILILSVVLGIFGWGDFS
jgi:hypothetical protein